MSQQKVVLGKGIGALFKEASNVMNQPHNVGVNNMMGSEVRTTTNNQFEGMPHLVSISEIHTNPHQPRKIFKEKELEELAHSIKENGVIQPLIVEKAEKGFRLIAGERRLRASKKAGLEKVPVIIRNRSTEKENMVISILENIQRENLNCLEEAAAYLQLMDDYGLTQEEIAKKLGKERSSIANFLRILTLPHEVREMVSKEQISFGHAKILVGEKNSERCKRLANEVFVNQLSVRELEKLLKARVEVEKEPKKNPYFEGKLDQIRQQLEQRTGFHFHLKTKKNGNGQVVIKFNNEAEFNTIYDYLLRK